MSSLRNRTLNQQGCIILSFRVMTGFPVLYQSQELTSISRVPFKFHYLV
jgi:hypothetical protein